MVQRVGELDINLLLALEALLREGNVTRAAAELNITQSALSGRLNKLRQILNDPLFLPASAGRGVTATPMPWH
ncbi:LysR family transcriptional regulator [Pseudorhizobium endolithicum]|uniref:LysR family transcriptional regulator n=1 Tax=Pseudorhizobium endolithicum TaxID=1191678 RepID=A0ABN7JYD7_9HYPH|nr:LysR family transcriptional regulator [Pseudorhizobium endolithicum]CAD7054304.1 LysR family transcriptional regulator [Pseudorhizobium endolithicum]